MKWPKYIALIRHDKSEYNALKDKKKNDPVYQKFLKSFNNNPLSKETKELAKIISKKYSLKCGDFDTPLALGEGWRAKKTGKNLKKIIELPDVVLVSPYLRTKQTLEKMRESWPELLKVKTYEEERIREQEHGLLTRYNDQSVFFTFHPEQKKLYEKEGSYRYCYPQGENKPRVRERCLLMTATLIREFSGKKVLMVTHHISILSFRANYERLNEQQFIKMDKNDKPINCGVTLYKGNARGKLNLEFYNRKLF